MLRTRRTIWARGTAASNCNRAEIVVLTLFLIQVFAFKNQNANFKGINLLIIN